MNRAQVSASKAKSPAQSTTDHSVEAAVELTDVAFGYPSANRLALSDVSVHLPAGAITAILGPNGSGKTTLLHLTLGIIAPTAGRVTVAGQPQSALSRRALSQLVGLVPQEEGVVFDLAVFEYVLLGRAPYLGLLERPSDADRAAAEAALDAVNASALSDRTFSSLSGGERQIVIVARALAQQPRILILDEPTSHLDLGNQSRLMALLRRLRGEGRSIVFTTHDPNAAAAISDHVVLLNGGRVLAEGAVPETLTARNLSDLYGVSVEVVDVGDRRVIVTR